VPFFSRSIKNICLVALGASLGTAGVVWAAQSNFLGVVFVADPTTTTQQMKVNSDGSINTTSVAGSGIGITPTDHTITSASGSSQQIMAANASRHSLTIVNTGNANCGVNPTGGTAVIGGAATMTLSPLGAYTPRVPTLSAVTVICTAGQPIYGDDN